MTKGEPCMVIWVQCCVCSHIDDVEAGEMLTLMSLGQWYGIKPQNREAMPVEAERPANFLSWCVCHLRSDDLISQLITWNQVCFCLVVAHRCSHDWRCQVMFVFSLPCRSSCLRALEPACLISFPTFVLAADPRSAFQSGNWREAMRKRNQNRPRICPG